MFNNWHEHYREYESSECARIVYVVDPYLYDFLPFIAAYMRLYSTHIFTVVLYGFMAKDERVPRSHIILNLPKHRWTCAVELVQQRLVKDKRWEANNRLNSDQVLRTCRNTKFITIITKALTRLPNKNIFYKLFSRLLTSIFIPSYIL
jgi:hypothetical protein